MATARFTMDFKNYAVTPMGLQGVPLWTDRLATCNLRDGFFSKIKEFYSTLSPDQTDLRQIIELMTVSWAVSVMKIGHAQLLAENCRQRGMKVLASANYPTLSALASGTILANDESYVRLLCAGPAAYPRWRWPFRLARLAVSSKAIPPLPRFLANLDTDIIATAVTPGMERHAAASDRCVRYMDAAIWCSATDNEGNGFPKCEIDGLLACTQDALESFGLSPSPIVRRWLRRQISLSAGYTNAYLGQLAAVKSLPCNLWVGTGSHYWSRMLSYEVLRRGGEVTAYDHGVGGGLFNAEWHALHYQSVCSKFLALDSVSAASISDNFERHSHFPDTIPRVESLEDDSAGPDEVGLAANGVTTVGYDCNDTASHQGKVLFIPLALTGELMHATPYPDDLSALDFTIRAVGSLMSSNFRVTLRPHPEFPFPSKDELRNVLNVELEERPFEQAIQYYDFLVFGYPTTTTLKSALNSTKPIVLFDLDSGNWNQQTRRKLESRCVLYSVSRQRNGRLIAPFSELPAGLERALRKVRSAAP